MAKTIQIKELDKTDKEILRLLQENAKMSLRDLEKEVNLSTTAIRLRIKNLEERELWLEYVATLTDDALNEVWWSDRKSVV